MNYCNAQELGPGKVTELRDTQKPVSDGDGVFEEMTDGVILVFQQPPPPNSHLPLPTAKDYFR